MAVVRVKGNPEKGLSLDNMKKVTPDAMEVLDSLAVFHREKLIGFLSLEDTRNYLWVVNNLVRTSISVPCKKKKYIAVKISNSNTKTIAKMVNGSPVIKLNINTEAYLDGTQCTDDLTQIKTYKKYEKLTEKKIEREIASTIRVVQKKYKNDIFGFGESMYRQDYQQFKKVQNHWHDSFTEAKVYINADVHLRRTGIRTGTLF